MDRRQRVRQSASVFQGRELPRLLGAIVMLAVLGLLIARAADPQSWRWLEQMEQQPAPTKLSAAEPVAEKIVPGPNPTDPEELAAATDDFQAVTDRRPLEPREMKAYWRLMGWSRTAAFEELKRRARSDVLYTNLWEQPAKHRGKLISLRLHLRRVLTHEAADNPAGVTHVYEAWGFTKESQSFPYLIVFSELPPGMPLGADVEEQGVFVGYFLKLMAYEAPDQTRALPLLIGRLRRAAPLVTGVTSSAADDYFWPLLAAGIVVVGLILGWNLRSGSASRRQARLTSTDAAEVEEWLEQLETPAASERERHHDE